MKTVRNLLKRLRPPESAGALLILGDPETMRREGHSELFEHVQTLLVPHEGAGFRLRSLELHSQEEIDYWTGIAHLTRYDAVFVLAHGSPEGLVAAPDAHLTWADLARRLAPTEPKLLFAVSCYSGLGPASDQLFAGIPSLEVVIGSPGPVTVQQAAPGLAEFAFAARRRDFPDFLKAVSYGLGPIATKGVLFRRTRAGHQLSSPRERIIQDVAGLLLPYFLR
jgi:hypothetical protein